MYAILYISALLPSFGVIFIIPLFVLAHCKHHNYCLYINWYQPGRKEVNGGIRRAVCQIQKDST